MENNELKKISIKNKNYYYFYDINKLEDLDHDNILKDEKSHKNILIYEISYKTLIVLKPLQIRFHKLDRIVKIYDGSKYSVLLVLEKYDAIYNRTRYLTNVKE